MPLTRGGFGWFQKGCSAAAQNGPGEQLLTTLEASIITLKTKSQRNDFNFGGLEA